MINEALLKEIDLIARLCRNNEAKLRQVAIANGIDPLKAEANSWYQNARAIALAIWPEIKVPHPIPDYVWDEMRAENPD
jgi:hypothetical protein